MNYFEQKNKDYTPPKKLIQAFIVLLAVIIGFGAGLYIAGENKVVEEIAKKEAVFFGKITGKYSQLESGKLAQDIDFDLFWNVWDTLKSQYVDEEELNDKKMFYGAIRGMVGATSDPYTVFLDPSEAQEFANDLEGTFEGIGAEIGIRDDVLTIIAPLAETPAEKAGLRAGDKIFEINGESTLEFSIFEAVQKIRGPKGESVVLTIAHKGSDEIQEITIVRDKIVVSSIKTNLRDDNIYVIQINNFHDDTAMLLNEAAQEILTKNPAGIILDLRNNPGGYLDTAIEVSSEWVEEGIIVSEQFGDDKKNDFMARGRARLNNFKTIVLVNEGSASASEIVAGALKDHGIATILGTKTFGKGSVQALQDFEDGSAIKITVAKWLTPNGNNINNQGIEPDVIVEMTPEDYNEDKDPQLEKAVELIKTVK